MIVSKYNLGMYTKIAIANVAKGLEIARQGKHLVLTKANAQKRTL